MSGEELHAMTGSLWKHVVVGMAGLQRTDDAEVAPLWLHRSTLQHR